MAKRSSTHMTVGKTLKKRLANLRNQAGWSQEQVAIQLRVPRSTIGNLLNLRYKRRSSILLVKSFAALFGKSLEELATGKPNGGARDPSLNFSYLLEAANVIDETVMPVARTSNVDADLLLSTYSDLMGLHSSRAGIDLNRLRVQLNSHGIWEEHIRPRLSPDLQIDVADDLRKMTYTIPIDRSHTMQGPHLLRNCLCPTLHERSNLCPLHESPLADEIITRFDTGLVKLRYMNTDLYFTLYRSLWPPSMDSMVMARRLDQAGVFLNCHRTVLDLGSGTGVLGLIAMRRCPFVVDVQLTDWMLLPLIWSSLNWTQNRRDREHVQVNTTLGIFDSGLSRRRHPYDLCLCNPPYLPESNEFTKLNMKSAVYGTGLLRYLIFNHQELARETYVQFSNISMDEALRHAKLAGVEFEPVGPSKELPLVLSSFRPDPGYISFLRSKGLRIRQEPDYPYWHEIQTYRLRSR